jgi:hypothetical protein
MMTKRSCVVMMAEGTFSKERQERQGDRGDGCVPADEPGAVAKEEGDHRPKRHVPDLGVWTQSDTHCVFIDVISALYIF